MAELLIKAQTTWTNPDPIIDARGVYKKGDIVVVRPDGHEWGGEENLPNFVLLKVPGVTVEQVENRIEEWHQIIEFEVVATDASQDGARIRLYTTIPGAANQYGITRAQVEGFIDRWGGSVVSVSANEVRFDITVEAAYKSEEFWGRDPAALGVVITETAYDQGTGVHTAEIDVSGSQLSIDRVQRQVAGVNGTVVSVVGDVITAKFARADVRAAFLGAIKYAASRPVVRRRYAFHPDDVDTAIAQGGTVTLTAAQANAKIIDKAS